MGLIKRQAAEFRAQFDEAMREAELDQMKAEVEKMSREIEESVRDADHAVQTEMGAVHREMGDAVNTIGTSDDMSSGAMGPQRKALPAGDATEVAADTSRLRCRARAPAITKPAPRWEHGSLGVAAASERSPGDRGGPRCRCRQG